MIFVDANYFLRALVRPVTPHDQVMAEAIFQGIRDYVEGPQSENTSSESTK